jgi:8-oxo-dGTP pyrophosphatase MutT (NUDIX family)
MAEHAAEKSGDVWEILGSKYVVKDRWLTLRADDCRNAECQVIAPYYVLEYPPCVNVLALTPEHDVVLIRQYRHAVRQVILELPGGAVDEQDASVLDAAQRELREETGYVAEEWRETGNLFANPVNHTNTMHCFLAFGAKYITEPQRERSEHIEVVLMSQDELRERAYRGELRHPHHVAALFFAARALGTALWPGTGSSG